MTLPLEVLYREVEIQLDTLNDTFTDNWEGVKGNEWGEAEKMTVYGIVKAILSGESTLDYSLVAEVYQQEVDIEENETMGEMMDLLSKAGYDGKDVGLLHSYLKSNNV